MNLKRCFKQARNVRFIMQNSEIMKAANRKLSTSNPHNHKDLTMLIIFFCVSFASV